MPSDQDLFIKRHTMLKTLSDAQAANALAMEHNLSNDSLRGRLSRANTPKNWAAVARHKANNTDRVSPSITRQIKVLDDSAEVYQDIRANLGSEAVGVFLSDVHAPYTRWDAWELTLRLLDKIQPDFISGQNDFLDNKGFGRWEDDRPHGGKAWSMDQAYMRDMEASMYRSIQEVAPQSHILAVAGNHDNWYHRHLRKGAPQAAEALIADYMEFLWDLSVLQFSRGFTENYIELSPGLIWWHGQFTSKLPTTNARNTLTQFMKKGQARSVIVGHTHRPATIEGHSVGLPGVTFINAPCLSRLENVPYMKRDPSGWALGIVVSHFQPETTVSHHDLLEFKEEGNCLICYYEGRRYAVRLDKGVQNDYA